jgi:hypothetical protein
MRATPAWALAVVGLVALLVAPLMAGGAAHADPLPTQAAEVADYRISVSLDPITKQLVGQERIVWRNPSTDAVPDLWFHLYLNAFRDRESTFFRESGGEHRGIMMDGGWGSIEITALTLPDGTDLLKSLTFQAPDDDNRADRTVARVPLPQPVGPGATLTLDVRFKAQLPKVFARTGYARDFFLVGQWFPKLAVYEPVGLRGRTPSPQGTGAWNAHQFHAASEFYADFGHYHVDMTVPSAYRVGATGQQVARRDNGNGTTTFEYDQHNVHDFAWTASPHFIEVRHPFVASREVTAAEYEQTAKRLNRTPDEVKLQDVEVIFLMQPAHMGLLDRHVRAAMTAIKHFGLWYGRYPHRTLTIVDPGYGAEGAGGMEYPTFITAGTSVAFNVWPFTGVHETEATVVHEFGHQYWQGMVANNEFEEAWLDEGMNSYSTGRVMEKEYGYDATMVSLLGLQINEQDVIRLQNSPDANYDTIRQPAWTYPSFGAYAYNSYTRPELTLRTLEQYLGPEVMARAMRTYSERWRFKHPSSDDFFAVLTEVSGRNLRPMLERMFERGYRFDYALGSVTSVEEEGQFATRVTIRRRGEIVLPVDILFKFAGKPVERVRWDGEPRQRVFTWRRPERLEWVNVDPERRYELDYSWINNSARVDRDARSTAYLSGRVLFWIQQIVSAVGM